MVGRTPWSARVPLDPLLARGLMPGLRAAGHGRSMEEEAREILKAGLTAKNEPLPAAPAAHFPRSQFPGPSCPDGTGRRSSLTITHTTARNVGT